ncbi:hypothetical protein [Amycolatopsis sp. lyj-90]|uniref:hypothetical protein n=1 Tax=Amycolatopsis sp. lyj-90 TaxID=2789285 RepID=UPI00397E3B7A
MIAEPTATIAVTLIFVTRITIDLHLRHIDPTILSMRERPFLIRGGMPLSERPVNPRQPGYPTKMTKMPARPGTNLGFSLYPVPGQRDDIGKQRRLLLRHPSTRPRFTVNFRCSTGATTQNRHEFPRINSVDHRLEGADL